MKINKLIIYSVLSAFFFLFLSSCTKDPKDISDPANYNSNNFPTSIAQLKSVLGGIYAELRDANLWGFELNANDIYSVDHSADLGYQGDLFWSDLSRNSYSSTNTYVTTLWTGAYTGVQRANTFLTALSAYRKSYAVASDSTELSYEEGEAHFLRAVFYFYLVNMYSQSSLQSGATGDVQSVPIITSTATSLTGTYVQRSTARQVWDFIIQDLTIADQKLQKHVWDAADIGRIEGWAPRAMLGKVYVFTGDYTDAKTVLSDVIQNSGHTLMTYNVFTNMFNGQNEFNNESFFEINTQNDLSISYGIFSGPSITTSAGLIYAPTCMNVSDTTEVSNGYGNIFVHDKNLQRFGFNLPIWNMVLNPNYNPNQPANAFNLKYICDPNYVAQSKQLRTSQTVDPRLYISALQPWVDSIYTDSGNTAVKRIVLRCSNIASGLQPQTYGWSFKKYAPIYHNIFTVKATDNANFYVLRLADIYLLYAEACSQTNDNANAIEYINKVHRRAYGLNPDVPSTLDYKSLADQTKASDPVLGNNPLRYERFAELFAEGQWWFDVIRWKIGDQEAAYYQKTLSGPINWTPSSYYFPIPQTELDNNPSIKQTSGY